MRATCRVYDSYPLAEQVVRRLEADGVSSCDISVVATRTINKRLVIAGSTGLLGGLIIMPGLGPVVATGWAADAVSGSAGGGVAGILVGAGLPNSDAQSFIRAIQSGGTLVAVRSDLSQVAAIMDRHSAMESSGHATRPRHHASSGRTTS